MSDSSDSKIAKNFFDGLSQVVLAVGAYVEAGLGRLVVANVLRGYRDAIGDVEHQAVHAVVGGEGGDIDAQL